VLAFGAFVTAAIIRLVESPRQGPQQARHSKRECRQSHVHDSMVSMKLMAEGRSGGPGAGIGNPGSFKTA